MTADDNIPNNEQTVDASASAEQKPPEQSSTPPQPPITRSPIIPPLEPKPAPTETVRIHSRRMIPPDRMGVAPVEPPPIPATPVTASPEPMVTQAEPRTVIGEATDLPLQQTESTSVLPSSDSTSVSAEQTSITTEQASVSTDQTSVSTDQTSVSTEQPAVQSDFPFPEVEEKPLPEKLAIQNNCRHEYVRIYQRRLKGLDRRLVATRAYLPVGFKLGDFGHLSEGSYCFCTKCRKRLFPKRSQGEKDQARLERQQAKIAGVAAAFAPTSLMMGDDDDESILSETEGLDEETAPVEERVDEDKMTVEVTVDELEVESVDVEDIKAEGVKLVAEDGFEESCELIEDVDS